LGEKTLIRKKKQKAKITVTIILICTALLLSSSSSIATIHTLNNPKVTYLPSGWEEQTSGTTQNLNGISFTDTSTGSAVGNSATILRTIDEGTTWNPQSCSVSVDLFDVSFYDTNTGMAIGQEGTILDTSNGGSTWNTYQTGWMTTYYGAHMVSSTHGFVVGVNTIFQPLVTWTTDGWQTNNDVAFYLEHQSVFHEGSLRDVCFTDTNTGYTAAQVWNGEGAIARTINGGPTWTTIYWTNHALYGIDFPSSDVGYAVGAEGIIAKTTDGGDSWQLLNSGVSYVLTDVSFATETIGTAIGENGGIIRTEDGGTTWTTQDSGTTVTLNSINFINENTGFISGNSGTILHTTSGGWSNRPPEIPTIPSGPTEGVTNTNYEFTTSTTDPDEDDVYYQFDWGDGTFSNWIGPFSSGTEGTESHSWNAGGEYEIRAKAKDSLGESDWSDPHTITIIDGSILDIRPIASGLFKLKATIRNNGGVDAKNINWNINLDGGAFIGKISTGTISSIPAGGSFEISSDLIIGLGSTTITVEATGDQGESDTRVQTGLVLLFFIKVDSGGG
jgi:photosystem II stability/assembly factor-like uncharacterized protein